uniref:Uncharacterized protein n=1 Tax=Anopheles farauti TaxID=69004 RepID=A0A182QBW2_9DIPT
MTSDLEDIVEHMRRFAWPDYLVFVSMLLLCILIGVYFGFVQHKPNTESEYLMGGRTMLSLTRVQFDQTHQHRQREPLSSAIIAKPLEVAHQRIVNNLSGNVAHVPVLFKQFRLLFFES